MSENGKDRAEYVFVKIALKSGFAQKIHVQSGRADEWPQNPTELAAGKEIAGKPCKQDPPRDNSVAAEMSQKLVKPDVARNAGKSDHRHVHELNGVVRCLEVLRTGRE